MTASFAPILISVLLLLYLIRAVINRGATKNNRPIENYLGCIVKLHVKKQERVLLFKDNEFFRILEPGKYWFFQPVSKLQAEVFDIANTPAFDSPHLNYLLKAEPALVEKHFVIADLSDTQVAILYIDNKSREVLPPATRKAYWKGVREIRTEVFNLDESNEIPEKLAQNLQSLEKAQSSVHFHRVHEYETALLYINGKLVKTLPTGLNAFWRYNNTLEIKPFDLRLQTLDVSGQEILTQDKVTLRVNLSADYKITDPLKVTSTLSDYKDFIYKTLQFALREVIGTRTLDQLLAEKDEISTVILPEVQGKLAPYGMQLEKVGVKDIILPGDMREIMNQVVEAEKQAQANLIKRREETAATRSLLNTAKVMEGNPVLLRLKELETLEKISAKIDNLSVYGGFDGLLKELVKIKS